MQYGYYINKGMKLIEWEVKGGGRRECDWREGMRD